MENLLLFLSRD